MFLRLVEMKVDPDRLPEMRDRYAAEIIPALEKTHGCLYAGLARSVRKPDRFVSLTLWQTPQHVEAYEQSGLFKELVDKTRPYFSEASEWKLDLSEDLRLEYRPVPVEPVVKSYDSPHGEALPLEAGRESCAYVRFVSMLVHPGKVDEFRALYLNQIVPTLRTVRGCCHVQMIRSVEDPNEFLSFTVWVSRQHAENYERSGLFTLLKDLLRPTLSVLSQWSMEVEDQPGTTASSEGLEVHAYTILTAKLFTPPP